MSTPVSWIEEHNHMRVCNLEVRFLTPAFLGDAEQSGRWRTPPFKHLLREWWRVAWAEANGYPRDHRILRQKEGHLFGTTADSTGKRSLVRLRLAHWHKGSVSKWNKDLKIKHPEVGKEIGAHLYLGYGPLTYDKGIQGTVIKGNAAIQAGEHDMLSLAYPESQAELIERALALIHAFGTLGGRSRNGWGSIALETIGDPGSLPLREWHDCLDRNWPHALGRDEEGPLIWHTSPFDDWRDLMKELVRIKIGLRTQFKFHSGKNAPKPEARHWLSYPVTNHSVKIWRNLRLPNVLRFKVVRDTEGRLRGRIFHMPCLPPEEFHPNRQLIERVWSQVHTWLDEETTLNRGA